MAMEQGVVAQLLEMARKDAALQRKLIAIALLDKIILPTGQLIKIESHLKRMESPGGKAMMDRVISLCREVGATLSTAAEEAEIIAGQLSYDIQPVVAKLAKDLGMQIFFCPSRHFAMYYPDGWELQDAVGQSPTNFEVLFKDPNGDGIFNVMLNPPMTGRSDPANPTYFREIWKATVKARRGKLVSSRKVMIAGQPAFEGRSLMRKYYKFGRFTDTVKKVAFVVGRIEFLITGQAPTKQYPRFEPLFDTCVQSITTLHVGRGPQQNARSVPSHPVAPDPEEEAAQLVREAYLDIENQRWDQAKAKLVRSLELYEASPDAHSELAMVLAQSGAHAEAEKHLRRAIELAPRVAKYRSNLAFLLIQINRRDEARHEVEEALKIDPRHPSARKLQQMLGTPRD